MPTLKADITLELPANLGDPVVEIALSAGVPISILNEWSEHSLIRDLIRDLVRGGEGRIFNVPKNAVEP
jgi:hypothetical protein